MARKARMPISLNHAMELCLEHARIAHRRSVDHIADLMGLPNKWMLYKWMESARIPAVLILPFEHACGADYMTRYLAAASHKLIIDFPSGHPPSDLDVADLQAACAEAVSALVKFYRGQVDAPATLAALTDGLTKMAWHRENVAKHEQPELGLFEGGNP